MNRRALYGIGVYLTIESCKAAQYSEGGTIIVTRALLGHPYMAQGPMETHLRRPNVEGMDVPHDSTIVAPGTPNGKGKGKGKRVGKGKAKGSDVQKHWEFVVPDTQLYPELRLDLFVPAFSRRFRSRPPSVLSLCAKMDPCESLGSRSGRDRCHLRDVVTTSDTDNLPEGMVQLVNDVVDGSGKGTNHCGTRVGLIQNCRVRCAIIVQNMSMQP